VREGGWQVGPARQRERESEQSGCARAVAGRQWAERGGSASARGGEAAAAWAESSLARGEGFLFYFLFSNSYFHFCFFFLLNNLFSR
jgi:hypothetical protein